jgi:outer membrane receptor protein involved in Fe transport
MKYSLSLILILLSFIAVFGQDMITIKGTVSDGDNQQPIEFATIAVYNAKDSSLISGGISEGGGLFVIQSKNVSSYVLIEFLSYQSQYIDIPKSTKNNVIDLGKISLGSSAVSINEVVITGQKSTSQFLLDKKVFNVGQDIASKGGTAQDLLNNVPSITVDVEGNLSLRGSGNVRVFINGRPSALVGLSGSSGLKSIPANQIERVEVITNPSARYEAEGMSGIINIILKKDATDGFNGSVELTGGLPTERAIGTNLNFRKGYTNFFINYAFRDRTRPGSTSSFLERFQGENTDVLLTERKIDRRALSHTLRSGIDFYLSEKQILTASFSINNQDEENSSILSYKSALVKGRGTKTETQKLTDYIQRVNLEDVIAPRRDFSIDYKKDFETKGRALTANIQYQNVAETENNTFDESQFIDNKYEKGLLTQRSSNDEFEKTYNIQSDYIHPFGDNAKFETGLRSSNRRIGNDFLIENQIGESWETVPSLSNDFRYDESVHGIYGIGSNKVDKLSYQFGLRYEYAFVKTDLTSTNVVNDRNYGNLFPSTFVSYELPQGHQVQASFSRRIRRPDFRDLNPFYSFTDRINFYTGNPDLNPEYTNSFELSHLKYFESANFGSSVYFRRTSDVISRFKSLISDGTTLTQPKNLGLEDNLGLELLGAFSGLKALKLDGEFNVFYNRFHQAPEGFQNLNAQTVAVSGRANAKLTFWKKSEMQFRWNYSGPRNNPQGSRDAFTSLDFGLNKDLMQNRLSISLNIRDIFNQRKYIYERFDDTFYEAGVYQFARNSGNITISYRINGQGSKQNKKSREEGDGGSGNMM